MFAATLDLFGYEVPAIDGLHLVDDFIDPEHENQLLRRIDETGDWCSDLQRRTKHFGRRYDQPPEAETAPSSRLPDWLRRDAERLLQAGYCRRLPDRVSVNEYLPGQGIGPHIDKGLDVIETIMIVSLGSSCVMEFSHVKSGEKIARFLAPRSLTVISGEARRDWMHGIPRRKSDFWSGARFQRGRRVSLMFRALRPATI